MRISDMQMFTELDFLREDFEEKRTDEKCSGNYRTQKKLESWQAVFQTVSCLRNFRIRSRTLQPNRSW